MAEKCKEYSEVCYGVGVLNEPQPSEPHPTQDELHAFLDDYFEKAIVKAREYLAPEVPVVLFSWVYDFYRWPDNRFPEDQFGKVQWDTHIYTPGASSVDEVLQNYNSNLD
jgi:hypothetical protein